MGEAVGQDWVKENFPPEDKAHLESSSPPWRNTLQPGIQSLALVTPETKRQAEAKLAAFRQKIGYPEKWRDYSKLEVKRDDLMGNIRSANAFETDLMTSSKISKPVDEKLWTMTPPTVNAYYQPSNNDIIFPAGILQPPFFDRSRTRPSISAASESSSGTR